MKLVIEPIAVTVCDGRPVAFRWRTRTLHVSEILDRWFWRGRWWHDAALQGERREYFRVRVGNGVYELYHGTHPADSSTEPAPASWLLSRRFD